MKINKFKINGFGKIKDLEIELSDGINVISGKNESGKSTMLKFISSMFYGTSKNKNGKDISDFDKYKPWKTEDFSGKISYTLDDGNSYEVYREFKKKNPIIYNAQKQDISKDFKIDKSKGIEYFIEQTGIDEETFFSTAITEQEGIRLSRASQGSIIQKISNMVSSGDDNISYKKSIDKISKMQNEEVGTERTSQRPINIVNNKINKLMEQKQNLEGYRESIFDNSNEKNDLKVEIKKNEDEKEFLKEVKSKLDNNRLKSAEINFNKNLESEYNNKINELNKKITEENVENNYKKINFKNYYISLIILIIAFVILLIVNNANLLDFLVLVPIAIILFKIYNDKKKISDIEIVNKEGQNRIINEIEVLKENQEKQRKEAKEKEEILNGEIERTRKEIISKYQDKVDIGFIENYLSKSYDEIVKAIEVKENRINTSKFKLQTMESYTKDINNKLEDLASIEEELQDAEEEKDELISLNNSYNIAKQCLEKAYVMVKENISPNFIDGLSKTISNVSNNRYKNVILNDTEGLSVEIEDGRYIPASRLSVGTIDQMYLSLRLSALKEISNEKMPIILDEAFAYFDDERLRNILKYLEENYSENQIIIFTCSNREKECLNKLNVNYNICNI